MNLRLPFMTVAFALGAFISASSVANARGNCTDGVDCYCDTINDPLLARCMDWEDKDFYEDGGSYPWHKEPSGVPGFRGGDGIWQRTFGPGDRACSWVSGEPANPTLGAPCTAGTCAVAAEWRPDNRYGGNAKACIDFQRNGDVSKEVPGLTLTGGHSGGEVFDGKTHLASRVRTNSSTGLGSAITPSLGTTMGITMARAYSTNLLAVAQPSNSDWISQPWKGEQTTGGMQFPEGNTGGEANNPPFSGGSVMAVNEATCDAVVSRANVLIGNIDCQGNIFRHGAARVGDCNGKSTCNASNEFKRSRDWPLGTWGCVRAYWGGMGTTNGEIFIDFQGPSDANPRRIFHVKNIDLAAIFGSGKSIGNYFFDTYYNGNDGGNLGRPATQTFYRYVDNLHIRKGEPVSCAQIGFDGATPLPGPAPLPPPVLLP